MKTIKAKHKAIYEPIADLVTYRVMPTHAVTMNQLDPFIFIKSSRLPGIFAKK